MLEHRKFTYDSFVRSVRPLTAIDTDSRDASVSARDQLLRWVNIFRITGSIMKPYQGGPNALLPTNVLQRRLKMSDKRCCEVSATLLGNIQP